MNIQVDIDSTLYDSAGLFARVADAEFGVTLPVDSTWWGSYQTITDSDTLHRIFRKSHSEKFVSNNEPYEGAAAVISEWADRGHTIYYVSDRHPQGHGPLKRWLESNRFPVEHDGRVVVGMDKRAWMSKTRPEVVIDDRVRTMIYAIYDLSCADVVASLRHPWNVNLSGEFPDIHICDDWQEIGKAIEQYL